MYNIQRLKINIADPIDSLIYVSNDNDEFVEDYIDFVYHNFEIVQTNNNPVDYKNRLLQSMTFYLPSCLIEDEEIEKWKAWNS